ncbi:MAG: hypothetical protein CMJ20_06885 [Phycisphaeraceae bacterium]|nr:hypothetical protein [Phycisphaeraceae bacterium]
MFSQKIAEFNRNKRRMKWKSKPMRTTVMPGVTTVAPSKANKGAPVQVAPRNMKDRALCACSNNKKEN